MPSNKNCSVFGCFNTGVNTANVEPKISFFSFPGRPYEITRKQVWVNFCKRQTKDGSAWNSTKNSLICSSHFINNKRSEDPRNPSFNPSIHPNQPAANSSAKHARFQRVSKRFTTDAKKGQHEKINPENILQNEQNVLTDEADILHISQLIDVGCQTDFEFAEAGDLKIFESMITLDGLSTYVVHKKVACKEITHQLFHTKATGPDCRTSVFLGYESVKEDSQILQDLTSVIPSVFSLLMSLLPKDKVRVTEMTWENRLLLFLMKLKLGISYLALGSLFGVHRTTASRSFHSILHILGSATSEWLIWPSRATVISLMPESFKPAYENCRVIVDCTECKTETPNGVEKQNFMYSTYKSSFTVKYLIGINPSGHICFLSSGYGGRSSDSFIVNDCGFLNKLEDKDMVMADKGFPRIELKGKNIVVTPPFATKNQSQFSEEQMNETYQIASVRIHVERAIQRIKIFNILTNTITTDLLPVIDTIMHFCCVLVNFQPPIIKT